ncbi:MAG: choline/ethanolamine kinase family protein, partial [Planctomycetaceae bacterium]
MSDTVTARIRALPYWQGEIHCEPLSGGITNQNFVVQDGATRCVARVCEESRFLGIDRRNERLCQVAAHRADVAPEILYSEDGILISSFIHGRTFSQADVCDPDILRRLAGVLRRLHDSRDQLTGELLFFCPFQAVRTYTATARALRAELPADIDDLMDDARKLSSQTGRYRPTLCHNDLLAANIMDDGGQIRIVDWEYAGIGNPVFDLASVAANNGLTDKQQTALVVAYAGRADPVMMRELQILKTVSLLREALWAVIQTVKSPINFDYADYAA